MLKGQFVLSFSTFCLAVFGQDADQPGLDLSEFPSLGNRNLPSTPISSVRNYGQYNLGREINQKAHVNVTLESFVF